MKNNMFQTLKPRINDNPRLRTPQQEAYTGLARFAENSDEKDREVGIVLPVGCGKSGCIAMAPFAFGATRTLIVAPSVKIAQQLIEDFDPARPEMFYLKCGVLNGPPYPEPVENPGPDHKPCRPRRSRRGGDQHPAAPGDENRWLERLPADFFDLILFDEGHHNVALSWDTLRAEFPEARIVNFSATPLRADGQVMAGRILYSYPVSSGHSGRLRQAPPGRCPQPRKR